MNAFYKGKPIFGPRGPAGPDGNPVGTVISFLGLTAPAGYLVCDGAEYEITAYPDLADHFRQQFGAANHFGGNGTDTFCVPDMRNLFLRGYHGAAEEQLSAGVGERQDGTVQAHANMWRSNNGINQIVIHRSDDRTGSTNNVRNPDSIIKAKFQGYVNITVDDVSKDNVIGEFTARPVNMAVLYCVKAI